MLRDLGAVFGVCDLHFSVLMCVLISVMFVPRWMLVR
jgi:hypothetical protein